MSFGEKKERKCFLQHMFCLVAKERKKVEYQEKLGNAKTEDVTPDGEVHSRIKTSSRTTTWNLPSRQQVVQEKKRTERHTFLTPNLC